MSREMCERLTAGKHSQNAVSRRPSGSCSTASPRNRSSDASTWPRSRATSPSSNGRCHVTFRSS